ncbi:MAG: hypothetical protein KGQ93_10480 [Cyanobacteria bacterium REEB459]|nr:hypothetical protein [Cyanobacteria bacterium REEB459]
MQSKTVALFLSLGLTSTLAACGAPSNQGSQTPPAANPAAPGYQKPTPTPPTTDAQGKDSKPKTPSQSKEGGEGGESGT